MEQKSLEPIVNLAKRRGFVMPSSEIYGGIASLFDYGPLGVELKNNLKQLWWKTFVHERDDVVGVDSSIIMHPKVWEASGHLASFSDPLVECAKCHARFREDHMPKWIPDDEAAQKIWRERWDDLYRERHGEANVAGPRANKALELFLSSGKLLCPNCVDSTDYMPTRQFNLMFKTFLGATEDSASVAYLRPETAQGMFTNFRYVEEVSRSKVPFGIAQVGKSFRNEVGLGNWLFRLREFEIAELEYFVKPGEDDAAFDTWVKNWESFLHLAGLKPEHLRHDVKAKEDLAHYSKATIDIEYEFPFGWSELAGIANRTDYDLTRHAEFSGKDLNYFDPETHERYTPYVIEPTLGVDRLFVAVLCEAYKEYPNGRKAESTDNPGEAEIVLHLPSLLAPYKVAVLPLVKKDGLGEKGKELASHLRKAGLVTFYDESGSIGRRYRRQDEIGTPWCVTVDYQTLEDNTVTIRDRDTMAQRRVSADELRAEIQTLLQA